MYEESEYKKPRRYRTRPQLGSISEATLRPEDLIPSFVSAVMSYGNPAERKAARAVERKSEKEGYYDDEETEFGECGVFVLTELLEGIASRYNMDFGAHPGDGADFGFWPIEPEDDDYIFTESGRAVIIKGLRYDEVFTLDLDTQSWRDNETGDKSANIGRLIRRRMSRHKWWSNVYEVNDHGNMTCYRIMSNGELRELWACV